MDKDILWMILSVQSELQKIISADDVVDIMMNSPFLKLIQENPLYVCHYEPSYWAKHIRHFQMYKDSVSLLGINNMTDNHGKVGEALYVKMTPEKFKQRVRLTEEKEKKIVHGAIFKQEDLFEFAVEGIDIHIDENTKGNYEVVCENGVEIW